MKKTIVFVLLVFGALNVHAESKCVITSVFKKPFQIQKAILKGETLKSCIRIAQEATEGDPKFMKHTKMAFYENSFDLNPSKITLRP